jgi:hypothetical protein
MMHELSRGWLSLAVVTGASFAAGPVAAQPSAEWQYAESAESCRASRSFDTPAGITTLQLRSFGPGSAVVVTVAGPEIASEPNAARMVELGWDGEGFDRHQVGVLGSFGGVPSVSLLAAHRSVASFAFFFEERAVQVSPLNLAAETMQLRVVGYAPKEIPVGSLSEPLRRLEECEARLMEAWSWGRDYAQRVATPPVMRDPQSWFYKAIVYPAVPNLNRISSLLQLRLKVDARGRVAECVVQSSPGSSQFGEKNCTGLRRQARFDPALDAQGQPVESYFQMSITFARYD